MKDTLEGQNYTSKTRGNAATPNLTCLHNSRQVKRNLRARKRFILAEKRAGRIAQTMDTKTLVQALRKRGCSMDGSEDLEQLRRVFVESIKPELRVRLRATSRYGKHGQFLQVEK